MRDVEQVLASSRREALDNMAPGHPLNGAMEPDRDCLLAWWHCHNGKIEMAWDLGLITDQRRLELATEWKAHHPA